MSNNRDEKSDDQVEIENEKNTPTPKDDRKYKTPGYDENKFHC